MAYSKAKLKSIGVRASPCFKLFLIGNLSDTFLPTRTLLYVRVRHNFISLTSFMEITKLNKNIIQDLPSNWIVSFLEVYKELVNWFIVFPLFSQIFDNTECIVSRLSIRKGWVRQNTTVFYPIYYADDDNMFRSLWAIFRSQKCINRRAILTYLLHGAESFLRS